MEFAQFPGFQFGGALDERLPCFVGEPIVEKKQRHEYQQEQQRHKGDDDCLQVFRLEKRLKNDHFVAFASGYSRENHLPVGNHPLLIRIKSQGI